MPTLGGTELPATLDPIEFGKVLWPTARFYDKEVEMVRGLRDSKATYVRSSNKAGKDFTAGFLCVSAFVAPWLYYPLDYVRFVHQHGKGHTRRILTTSIAGDHLRVLWAEIAWFLTNAAIPLLTQDGGPLYLTEMELRFASELHLKRPPNYLIGTVADKPEKLAGHHADYTFMFGDEGSGLENYVKEQAQGWAKREFYWGNPNACQNFYRTEQRGGDLRNPHPPIPSDPMPRWFRRVIQIKAEDSPNVKAGLEGRLDSHVPVPGVLSYAEYLERRATWDPIRQTVGLDAEFYEGAELKLVPARWLKEAAEYAKERPPVSPALRRWMGVDPAEGGDDTCWVIIDRHGVLFVLRLKTNDTNVVYGKTLELMQRFGVAAEDVAFDRGGGKEHADRLRAAGHNVRTVDFGTLKVEPKRGIRVFPEKREAVETKGEFKSRRSELYWNVRMLLERPLTEAEAMDDRVREAVAGLAGRGVVPKKDRFATPLPMCDELHRQLSVVPLTYDELGRFELIPKQDPKDDDPTRPAENLKTFRYLLGGGSPDVADAFALAVFAMQNKPLRQTAGPT